MKPPYRSDEVARAILAAARRRGSPSGTLEVVADESARVWIIRARDASGEEVRATFPFATARGILTPAAIADEFTAGSWPFA